MGIGGLELARTAGALAGPGVALGAFAPFHGLNINPLTTGRKPPIFPTMNIVRLVLALLLLVVAMPLAVVFLIVKASWHLAGNVLEWCDP